MLSVPAAAEPLLAALTAPLSQPVAQRLLLLAVGAILTTGRRTVTRILTTAGGLVQGHFTSYHRVFSRASWSTWAEHHERHRHAEQGNRRLEEDLRAEALADLGAQEDKAGCAPTTGSPD
jgi:hypothetical protein